jgi:hypothetical protein
VKIDLNPIHLFTRKATAPSAAPVEATVQPVAQAKESVIVSTAPVTPAPTGFKRFIDAIGSFFEKTAPILEQAAVAAEPLLALSPVGPEYDLVVNAIVGVQKTATASLSTGATLTAEQKMALVIQAITPGVTTVLASKGITETATVNSAIAQFAQNVYNFQAGPVALTAPAVA